MEKEKTPKIPRPEGLDRRIQELLEKRARSLGVSIEELRAIGYTKPRSLLAAQRRAEKLGKSIEELLIEDRLHLRKSNYPGPECLEPHEVEQYLKGELPELRLAHIDQCIGCDALVKASTPTDEQIDEFLREIRPIVNELEEEIMDEIVADKATPVVVDSSQAWRRRSLVLIGCLSASTAVLLWFAVPDFGPHRSSGRFARLEETRTLTFQKAGPAHLISVAESRTGLRLATKGEDENVRVWDLSKVEPLELMALGPREEKVRSMAFSPDGERLATVSEENTVIIWNAQTGQSIVRFAGLPSEIISAKFSPDGKALVATMKDGETKLLKFETDAK